MGPNGSNACTVCVFFLVGFQRLAGLWNVSCRIVGITWLWPIFHCQQIHRASILGLSANVTFSLCDLEEVIDMGAETYPQACERWGQAACKDFVCLFGSWTSWALGLLWGNSRANSHFAEAGSQSIFCSHCKLSAICFACCSQFMCGSPGFSNDAKADSVKASFFVMVVIYLFIFQWWVLFLTWISKSATDGP